MKLFILMHKVSEFHSQTRPVNYIELDKQRIAMTYLRLPPNERINYENFFNIHNLFFLSQLV